MVNRRLEGSVVRMAVARSHTVYQFVMDELAVRSDRNGRLSDPEPKIDACLNCHSFLYFAWHLASSRRRANHSPTQVQSPATIPLLLETEVNGLSPVPVSRLLWNFKRRSLDQAPIADVLLHGDCTFVERTTLNRSLSSHNATTRPMRMNGHRKTPFRLVDGRRMETFWWPHRFKRRATGMSPHPYSSTSQRTNIRGSNCSRPSRRRFRGTATFYIESLASATMEHC